MPIGFTIKAYLQPVVEKLGRLKGQQERDMKMEMDIDLLEVLRDSKTKPPRVPVDTGALQSTGFTEPAKVEGEKIVAAIGYGGATQGGKYVDYAVFVHDNLTGRIKNYRRPGSGPKFLETHLRNKQEQRRRRYEFVLGRAYSEL